MSRPLALWLAAAAIVALASVFLGRELKGAGPSRFAFETRAPAYSAADLPAGRSRAGFTGFSETGGLPGHTIVAGRVTAIANDSIALSTSTGPNTVRLTGEEKLRTLAPFRGAINPGTTVVAIRQPGADQAEALLLLLEP